MGHWGWSLGDTSAHESLSGRILLIIDIEAAHVELLHQLLPFCALLVRVHWTRLVRGLSVRIHALLLHWPLLVDLGLLHVIVGQHVLDHNRLHFGMLEIRLFLHHLF